jgi:ABC-type Na+ efflux pump permease subunit
MYYGESRLVNILAAVVPPGSALGAAGARRYIGSMHYVFPIFVLLAMLGVLGALGLGVINMARGGNPRRSNKLMQTRVILQAVALLFFAIFMLLFRHS